MGLESITAYRPGHGLEGLMVGILGLWIGLLLEARLGIELGVLRGTGELGGVGIRGIEIHGRQSLATSHKSD